MPAINREGVTVLLFSNLVKTMLATAFVFVYSCSCWAETDREVAVTPVKLPRGGHGPPVQPLPYFPSF